MATFKRLLLFSFQILALFPGKSGAAFTVKGQVVDKAAIRQPYAAGDAITYVYSVGLSGDSDVNAITIHFNSAPNYAKILSVGQLSLAYEETVSGTRYSIGSPVLNAVVRQDSEKAGIEVKLAKLVGKQDVITGEYNVTITDSTPSGDRIQSLITVWYSLNKQFITQPYVIVSQTVYVVPPSFDLAIPTQRYFTTREKMTIVANVNLQPGNTKIEAVAVMPMSKEEWEAHMSVDDVTITGSQAVTSDLSGVLPDMSGGMNNSISSVAELDLNYINVDGKKDLSNPELSITVTAHIEDYGSITDGAELWPGVSFMFGSGLLWVGKCSVLTNTSMDGVTIISSSITLVSSHGYDGIMNLTVDARFSSVNLSTAYARNLSAVIYVPPFVSETSLITVDSKSRCTYVTLNNGKIDIEASQVAFTMDTWVRFDVSLNADDSRYWKTNNIVLVMDVKYQGRSGSEYNSNSTYLNVDFNSIKKETAERLHWTKSSTGCTCTTNPSKRTCACCHVGGCQCDDHNELKCENCDAMWRCWPYVKDFSYKTSLSLPGDETIACKPFQRYRYQQNHLSCFLRSSGNWTGLSSVVSSVIGRNTASGTVYGVSNHGYGYVKSDDVRSTWRSITPCEITNARGLGTFEKATFEEYLLYD